MISKKWLLVFLLINGVVFGQTQTYDLKQCIELAKTKNPLVQQANLGLQINQVQLDQSRTNRYPNFNGTAAHNYNFGRSIDIGTNQFITQRIQSNSFSITTSVTLFNGFQLQNSVKQNKVLLDVSKKDIEVMNNNISLSVANAYLQILLAEEQLVNARKQKEITEAQLSRAKVLFDAGNISRSSVVNLEAQLAGDDVSIVVSQNNIRNGYAQIASLILADNYSAFSIAKPPIAVDNALSVPAITVVLEKAQSQMPEVEREKLKTESALYGLNVSKGGYYPRIDLIGRVNTVYSQNRKERYNERVVYEDIGIVKGTNDIVQIPFDRFDQRTIAFGTQLQDNFSQTVGLSLSVPIYNSGRVRNNVKTSLLNYEISKVVLENTLAQLRNDVIIAYANWENAKARYTSSVQNEAAQKVNFDFTTERFDAGLLNSVELLNAKNIWSEAQGNTVQARYELVFRKIILDFYQGTALSLQ